MPTISINDVRLPEQARDIIRAASVAVLGKPFSPVPAAPFHLKE